MPGTWRRPSRAQQNFDNGAIPRATEYRLYFRDRSKDPENPVNEDGSFNYLFPRKRLIIWAGNIPLYDGNSGYWDGYYPLEILDWGIETRHPYGESEIENLQTLQMAINIIISGIVDNARLINDPPWMVDDDALEPEQLQLLRKYGDRPGWPIVKRPGSTVRRDPPGALAGVVFQTLDLLQGVMEKISGVSPAMQGQLPGGAHSGVLLESLQLAGQIPIRLQGRGVEGFLSRIGQLGISRVIQYFTDERILYATDDQGTAQQVVFARKQFLNSLNYGGLPENERDRVLQNLFRDFRFRVVPGSALAVAKLQKLSVMERLNAAGKIPDIMVNRTAEIPEPERALEEARQEIALKQQLVQGGPPANPAGRGGVMNQRNLSRPAAQRSGAGGENAPFGQSGG